MTILRSLARPLLASVFIYDGIDAVVDSTYHATRFLAVQPLLEKLGVPPVIADDAEMLAKISGSVTALSGLGLAFGIAPRVNAATLAAINLPITLINTVFSVGGSRADHQAADVIDVEEQTETDQQLQRRNRQAVHTLLQGASVAGGLIFAMFDREGKPSVAWSAQAGAKLAGRKAEKAAKKIHREAAEGLDTVHDALS